MSRRAWALFVAMSALWGLAYLLIKVTVAPVALLNPPTYAPGAAAFASLPTLRLVCTALAYVLGCALATTGVLSAAPRRLARARRIRSAELAKGAVS
jgi:hypothetical protein